PYTVANAAPRGAHAGDVAELDVRIWQREGNLTSLFVSARPRGGAWEALGTIPVALDDGVTASGRLRYGNIEFDVPLGSGGTPLRIDLRLWQQVASPWGASARRLPPAGSTYIGARVAGGSWDALGMIPLPLSGRVGSDAPLRYGDIALRVPLPGGDADRALPTATVVLPDGYSTAGRIAWRQRLEEEYAITTAFFAHRYGLTAEGVTLVMADSGEPASYGAGVVELKEGNLRTVGWGYVHALREKLSDGALPPAWLMHGMVWHFTDVRDLAVGWRAAEPGLESAIGSARGAAGPLRSDTNVQDCGVDGLLQLATARLVERAGESALWDFSRRLSSARSWEIAFADAFGVSVDAFYEAFDVYREEIAPPLPHIQGVVLGPDARPAQDLEVWPTRPGGSCIDETGADGTFSIAASGPVELFVVHPRCGTIGYYDGAGGLLDIGEMEAAAVIEVGDAGVTGIAITLPLDPHAPCVDAGDGWWTAPEGVDAGDSAALYRISGVVLGPDGEPVEGVSVYADAGRGADVRRDETGPDGTFTLLAPAGWYRLGVTIVREAGWARSGWYGGESGFTTRSQRITLLAVDDGDVTGLVVNLPEFR
ncbi:MAG: carboxypeptidase regulatory-like domain-containing protein, partial [Chloroflexi bacterium]|nr:carboxypeptidase regulatory-like domain-containing protein [Chloroflexota bacterium]